MPEEPSERATPQPLKVPEVARKLAFWKHQWLGIPFLMSFPILAMLGVFGESIGSAEAAAQGIQVSVTFPDKIRYRQTLPLVVRVRNDSESPISRIDVHFDENYLREFSSLAFNPLIEHAFRATARNVEPGETRLFTVELQAIGYGSHEGTIQVAKAGEEIVRVPVRTFVFP